MVQPEKKGLSQDAWSVRGSREGEEVISSVWLEQVGLGDEVTFAPETSTPPPKSPTSGVFQSSCLALSRGQLAGRGGDGTGGVTKADSTIRLPTLEGSSLYLTFSQIPAEEQSYQRIPLFPVSQHAATQWFTSCPQFMWKRHLKEVAEQRRCHILSTST